MFMLFKYGCFQDNKKIAHRKMQLSQQKLHCLRLKCLFASAVRHISPKLPDCEEAEPARHSVTRLHQEAPVQQKLPAYHPGLCQRHHAPVWPDGFEGAVFPTQGHLQPPHHRKQVPRGIEATPAPQQGQRLPQLHHLLQRGDRWDTSVKTGIKGVEATKQLSVLSHFGLLLPAETPAPFAVNENTTELVVTAPLDREESESYRLLLVCTIRTETLITKVETSLDVFVDDEDDNAPYLNGTDTADVVIGFNRTVVRRVYTA